MAILKIARMGHPVLRRAAAPVAEPLPPDLAHLIEDMWETMRDAGGVGLAAPQVHVPLRVVVFCVPPHRAGQPEAEPGAADGPVPPTVLINPEITPLSTATLDDWESCLSVPGLMGRVSRWAEIRYAGLDRHGHRFERRAEGFHARVVQHECDHLDGVLYPMRMTDLRMFGFADDIRRHPPHADGDLAHGSGA